MRIFVTMIALCLAPPAVAETRSPPQDCTSTKAALPPELSEWSSGVSLAAAASIATADHTMLVLGKTARLRLVPKPAVQFALPPKKPGTVAVTVAWRVSPSRDLASTASRLGP